MKIRKKIIIIGAGVGIVIPKKIMKKLNLQRGNYVIVDLLPEKIKKKTLINIVGNYLTQNKKKKLEITKNE